MNYEHIEFKHNEKHFRSSESVEYLKLTNCDKSIITKLVVEVYLLGHCSGRYDGQHVRDYQINFLALLGLAYCQTDALSIFCVAPSPVNQWRVKSVDVEVVTLQYKSYVFRFLPCPIVLSLLS